LHKSTERLVLTSAAGLIYDKNTEAAALATGTTTTRDVAVEGQTPPKALNSWPYASPKIMAKRKVTLSPEHERCIASIIATVKRLAVVDRDILHALLMYRSDVPSSGSCVDGETWSRLISHMILMGGVQEAKLLCCGSQVNVLLDAASDADATEDLLLDFARKKIHCRVEGLPERSGEFQYNKTLDDEAWSVQELGVNQERFADLSMRFRLELDHSFKAATGLLPNLVPLVTPGTMMSYYIEGTAVVCSALIKSFCRHVIKTLLYMHRCGVFSGFDKTGLEVSLGAPNNYVPSPLWHAVGSWLSRCGWAMFLSDEAIHSSLTLPIPILLSSCDLEVANFLGVADLFCAPCKQDSMMLKRLRSHSKESTSNAPEGGCVAFVLAASMHVNILMPLTEPRPWGSWDLDHTSSLDGEAQNVLQQSHLISGWRQVVTSDFELWTSPDSQYTHLEIRLALRRVIFAHCLFHVGTTANAIAKERRSSRHKLHIDHLEIFATLLDLVSSGILRADRAAPTQSNDQRLGVSIFSSILRPGQGSFEREAPANRRVYAYQAIAALRESAGLETPRFFLNRLQPPYQAIQDSASSPPPVP